MITMMVFAIPKSSIDLSGLLSHTDYQICDILWTAIGTGTYDRWDGAYKQLHSKRSDTFTRIKLLLKKEARKKERTRIRRDHLEIVNATVLSAS